DRPPSIIATSIVGGAPSASLDRPATYRSESAT
ncbi:MAG: hypothetical protein HW391_1880, partial [Chloroflexi bacterium]|nr:hypothetical protein [Chloroflexota bacterium]